MEVNKYQRAKVYKIISPHTDKIYIGSTVEKTLAQRLAGHVRSYKCYLAGKYHYVSSFEILQHPEYRIVLVDSYPCDSRDRLLAREQHHIDLAGHGCVNMQKAFTGLTEQEYKKQYHVQHRDVILERVRQYTEQHRDQIRAYKKQHREQNKDIIVEKKKQHYNQNKDRINTTRKQKIQCDCGSVIALCNKAEHERTFIHTEYIEMTL